MHIGWGGGGCGGYIQKFLSTVLVPLNYTFLARNPPHTHTHTKYSLPPSQRYSYLTLTLMRA